MLCDSEKSIIELSKDSQDNRVFDYTLNQKRAKAKLLKGAMKKKNLDVEIRPGCVNLRFDNGSYFELILPLLRDWIQKVNQVVKIGETEIKIIEVYAGKEQTGNHVDTKLVVMHENDRLVFHAYNGTQNLMIQGKNYEHFALQVLEPIFSKHIEESLDKITNFNTKVKEQLGPKKSLKLKVNKPHICPQCNIITKTPGDLKVHLQACHSKPSIMSPNKNKILKVLDEDTSIIVDDKTLEVDTKLAIIDCRDTAPPPVLPLVEDFVHCNICEFDTLIQEELDAHMSAIHGHNQEIEKADNQIFECVKYKFTTNDEDKGNLHTQSTHEDSQFKCYECDLISNSEDDLKQHKQSTHDKVPAVNSTTMSTSKDNIRIPEKVLEFDCKKCPFTTNNEKEKLLHNQSKHMNIQVDLNLADQNVIKCKQCEYKCRYTIQIKKHMKNKHGSEPKYKCKQCEFVAEYVADTWEHTLEAHPEESDQESDKENIIPRLWLNKQML